MLSEATPLGRERVALPPARGPWTGHLYELLGLHALDAGYAEALARADSVLDDHDLQMALYLCYELHYAGLANVPDAMEWSPVVLTYRASMEEAFEAGVRALCDDGDGAGSDSVGEQLRQLVAQDRAPSLSRYVQTQATREQVLEHVVHRSAYQLKEADPHSWAIPRLTGAPKAALVEVQADEYGGGRAERMHSVLFANTMQGLGLDPRYGAYLAHLPGITLATVNLMSWFGLHRRWRGAVAGHMAVFEMTSSTPNRRYGDGLRRLGYGPGVTLFYDEHVEADAVHESIALWDLADRLARSEPDLAPDVLFGGRALLALEGRWATHLMNAWERGESSLLEPLAV
jgi:hypothetical protein